MRVKIIKLVTTNDRGYRIGESHFRARLTDREVEEIRDLREYGGWSYDRIARTYGVPKETIAAICRYERRAQTVVGWKKVEVAED